MKTWTIRLAALLLAAALFPACNSSSSTGGPTRVNAVVAGTHFIIWFWGDKTGHTDGSATGTVTMDGAGSADSTVTENVDGTVTAGINSVDPYSAYSNGSLVISPAGLTLSGGYDINTELSVLGSTNAGSPPIFYMTVLRNGTALGDASMNGAYTMVSYMVDPVTPDHRCESGTATFDGAGNLNAVTVSNNEGTIGAGGGAATYSVAADGAMTLTTPGGTYTGGLLDGGNIAILGATTGDPGIMIFVKQIAGAHSDADLTGAYWIATLGYNVAADNHDVEVGSATFDGAGSVSVTLTENEEGFITKNTGGVATYSIDAAGLLTVNTTDTFSGGVLMGGQIGIAASTSGGSDPEVIVVIKK